MSPSMGDAADRVRPSSAGPLSPLQEISTSTTANSDAPDAAVAKNSSQLITQSLDTATSATEGNTLGQC